MNEQPAFTNHIATFGDFNIQFQRDRDGNVADIIEAWIYCPTRRNQIGCFGSFHLILTALNSDFPELISNCKDIKDL